MTKIYSPQNLRIVTICFVLSGATGLIYEVLWARMLGLVFGATTLAISAVLAAFMGGLALGSGLASRFAPRLTRPVRAYAGIEIVVGLYALAVPALFRGVDHVYAAAWQHLHPGFFASASSRFVLAAAVLVIPTALMGATLPVLAAALQRSVGRRPSAAMSAIARFYTWNLVGAIGGAIAAGFFLLPTFGVHATIWIAAATNLVIGLMAFLIDSQAHESGGELADKRLMEALPDGRATASCTSGETRASEVAETSDSAKFWLFCAFISGFMTISMQVVWSRVLAMIIGSSTYAFSIVLALFLVGLAFGAYIASAQIKPDAQSLRRAVLVIEVLTALTLFLSLRITSGTPDLLISNAFRLGINSWLGLLVLQLAVAALLILLPATLMGMVMPVVLIWTGSRQRKETGEVELAHLQSSVRLVGQSYALNTVGAIAGSVIAAFLLVPVTSTRFTVFCVAALGIIVAGIAYEPRSPASDRGLARSLAVGVSVALILAMFVFWPRLNLNALSTGAYDSYVRVLAKARGGAPEQDQNDGPANHQLLMYEEGRTATVSVRRDWGITSVAINGRTNASDSDDMPTQVMLGQFGVLTAPRIGNALIVGFATGVTAGSVLLAPIDSVACVEIEPAAVASSRFFEHINNHPLTDPRLHLIVDDARTYLRVSPVAYDLIVSEPSHPWVPGVANLFTREFFTLGKERLRDDGVFVQWLQIYQLSAESLKSVLATFHEVFPHVAVFRVLGAAKGKDLILIGSRAPLTLDRAGERMNNPRIAADLARVGIKSIDDLRAWFVVDEIQLGPAVAGAIINTDDNMHVETVAPREAFRPTMEENSAWLEKLKSRPIFRP